MNNPSMLTRDLLEGLGARWEARNLPVLNALTRGLTDAEIDAIIAPLGLRLPDEARERWRWRDGVVDVREPGDRYIGPGVRYLPLSAAVDRYLNQRALAEKVASEEDDPTHWWQPNWFPIVSLDTGGEVAVDCAAPVHDPSPVRVVDWWREDFMEPVAPSLGAVVEEWIDAFDSGRWRWVAEGARRWERKVVEGYFLS